MRCNFIFIIVGLIMLGCRAKDQAVTTTPYEELHRPQFHFTPKSMWMNDPNGMVYIDGKYHLFYQHYPDSTVWGPMHWGHAVSDDLIRWEHLPVALYPDSLGMIFSGSAVVDAQNTSGLGTKEASPMVAIFTYHFMAGEKAGRIDYQTQGLAFSLDKGKTWTKYKGNPILRNPGIKDFRDPKVFWHEDSKNWIMTLAAADHVELYGSPNLIEWKKLSEFGKEYGSHGGVWECPDLFQLQAEGSLEKKWVLLLSINPGGPNGGSATQYFIGDFDGKTFNSETKKQDTLWIDYGPDDYAGVTWSNIPRDDGRRIFLGWMSNWAYANVVPTSPWRSAMTVPRQITLKKIGQQYYLNSLPVAELGKLVSETRSLEPRNGREIDLYDGWKDKPTLTWVEGRTAAKDFTIELANDKNEKIIISYEKKRNRFAIDRSSSGEVDFSPSFGRTSFAPRISKSDTVTVSMVIDVSSVELFFDGGSTNLTALFFPTKRFGRLVMRSIDTVETYGFEVRKLKGSW
jgi:fructan beta-fructosidase